MPRFVTIFIVVLASCCATCAQSPPSANSDSNVTKWIAQLDSDAFAVRESATKRLIDAGAESIPALETYVANGSMEASVRGLTVLRELALQDNHVESLRAEKAIASLASDQITAASFRAADLLASLQSIRTARGLKMLRRLGMEASHEGETYDEKAVSSNVIYTTFGKRYQGTVDDAFNLLPWLSDYAGVHVTLEGKSFDDTWLEALSKLDNVISLRVSRAGITNAGIQHLQGMQSLKNLSLRYCDLVSSDGLRFIEGHASLQSFSVAGGGITQAAFEQLAAKHQGWNTRYGRGGFLGIAGVPYDLNGITGCLIRSVTRNKPAELAGLRMNDIIIKYEDEEVYEFMPSSKEPVQVEDGDNKKLERKLSLSELIGSNLPGDRVEITVLRQSRGEGMQPLVVEVELGEWP